MDLECPECGNTTGADLMGHEVQGIYDGVLFWSCLSCGYAWPRDFGNWDRIAGLSREYAAQYNAARHDVSRETRETKEE